MINDLFLRISLIFRFILWTSALVVVYSIPGLIQSSDPLTIIQHSFSFWGLLIFAGIILSNFNKVVKEFL